MKPILVVVLSLLILKVSAQQRDFIVIKKKGVTYKTFFSGAQVTFLANTGSWYTGKVTDIRNDSLFFRELVIRQVATPWGVPRLDTMTSFVRKFHFRDIIAIPKKKESFSYIKNGNLLMIGGGGYILLNVVNSAYLHYNLFGKNNLPGLLTATGALASGFIISKLHKSYYTIGKKFTVEYVKI